jgi:hypothetical protein
MTGAASARARRAPSVSTSSTTSGRFASSA